MEIFRGIIAVSYCNISRWKKDYRVWLILIFTALLIVEYLKGYTIYGIAEGKKMTFCMLPILFQTCDISLRAPKVLWHIGYILLLCDAPFLNSNALYVIMRSGRKKWWIGECLYIFEIAFLYMGFITIVSSALAIPVISFENDWGDVLVDFINGTDTKTVEELLYSYHLGLGEPERAISMLYPFACEAYTFFTGIASFSILGLLLYLVNLVQKNIVWGIGTACMIVFLDPILTYLAKPANYWLQAFSPVCWTSVECINLLGTRFFISIPFVTAASLIVISVLLIFIALFSKKMIIETREEY